MKSWILFRTQRRPTCLLLHVGGSSHRPLSVVGPRHTRPPPHVTPGPRHTPHSAPATLGPRHTPQSAPATFGPCHTRPRHTPHSAQATCHTGLPPHWAHVTLGPATLGPRHTGPCVSSVAAVVASVAGCAGDLLFDHEVSAEPLGTVLTNPVDRAAPPSRGNVC